MRWEHGRLEAESGTLSPPMRVWQHAGASGQRTVGVKEKYDAKPDPDITTEASAFYQVNVPDPGRYILKGRAYAESQGSTPSLWPATGAYPSNGLCGTPRGATDGIGPP